VNKAKYLARKMCNAMENMLN